MLLSSKFVFFSMQRACEGAPDCHHGPLSPLWLEVFLALQVQVSAQPLHITWALLRPPFCDVLDLSETQM